MGRGLAGILGDALAAERAPGVSQLLGLTGVRRHPEVRRLVSELALSAMADGFGAQTVLLVSQDADGRLSSMATRLAPNWNLLDAVAFETVGRLYQALGRVTDDQGRPSCALSSDEVAVEGSSVLVCRSAETSLVTATAVVRSSPFTPSERETIGRILRSVAVAFHGQTDPELLRRVAVEVEEIDGEWIAEVRLGASDDAPARSGRHVDADRTTAVAVAAASACSPLLEVTFAGETDVADGPVNHTVTVVVLQDGGGPLFGLAVTDPASSTGAAEAVLNAAGVIGLV